MAVQADSVDYARNIQAYVRCSRNSPRERSDSGERQRPDGRAGRPRLCQPPKDKSLRDVLHRRR